MRDRLIKLLQDNSYLDVLNDEDWLLAAEQLLANGVVVIDTDVVSPQNRPLISQYMGRPIDEVINLIRRSEWISVEDRLPESEKIVLVSAVSKTFRYRHTLMVAHIGHHEFTTEDSDWREYEGDTEYDEENDCFWIPECWYEVNSVEDNGNWIIDSDYDVTHWMPLPEAPKGGAE